MPPPQPLTRRLQTTAFSIEDLLDRVRRGEIRIPEFQRPLQWKAKGISDLLDSIYRGYPIGTLLFWRRDAPAAQVSFGPVAIDAPQTAQALWVVDGNQRLTALAGVLLHPPYPVSGAHDGFTLYFDLRNESLVRPKGRARPQASWLPLNVVADSELLLEWLSRYPGRRDHPEQTRAAMKLSRAIREYQIPVSIIEGEAVEEISTIFERLNSKGLTLTQADLSKARAAHHGQVAPRLRTLGDLAKSLRTLKFGKLEQALLIKSLFAVMGHDIATLAPQLKDVPNREEALDQAERALRGAIIFLKREAGVPHAALLPYKAALIVLARFFHLHPEPSARSRELLSRWFWRGALTKEHERLEASPQYMERAGLSAITADEERSVQKLLGAVSQEPRLHVALRARFDFSTCGGKILANALVALHPRDLRTALPLEVSAVLERAGAAALVPLISPLAGERASRANIIFHPPLKQGAIIKALLAAPPLGPEVLRSHGISQEALEALHRKDLGEFLEERRRFLKVHLEEFQAARARWGESDRGSLQSLIVADEED
jgi:hypothetical protein